MMKEIIVDVRELEPPRPLEVVLEAALSLKENEFIKMIHRQRPNLLFPLLEKRDFEFIIQENDELVFIFIWPKNNTELKKYIERLK